MNCSCAILNTIFYFHILVTDLNGDPKTGLTVTYVIYKSSDNSVVNSGTLSDVGNGTYDGSYTFTIASQYYIIYTTPTDFSDEIEGVYADKEWAKQDALLRSLGLNDENKKIIDTVYDSNSNLTAATVKLYPSATDFINDTNVMATYEFTATYNAQNETLTMGVKRI